MAKEKPAEQTKVWLLPIEKITPSPFQARTVFDEGEIKKLAVSILQNGLLQPISVRPTVDGRYQLIAGEKGELPYSHGCGEGKYLMFLYLNFPDLEEMRQMYLQHYK